LRKAYRLSPKNGPNRAQKHVFLEQKRGSKFMNEKSRKTAKIALSKFVTYARNLFFLLDIEEIIS
jgi:hypothetical protein